MEYEIGDEIMCTKNSGSHYIKGDTGKITHIGWVEGYGMSNAIWLDESEKRGGGKWVTPECIKLIKRGELMEKFKVGDRVELTKKCSGLNTGNTLIVYEIKEDGIYDGLWANKTGKDNNEKRGCRCQKLWKLIKRGEAMSLRQRIKTLSNGWDKDCDDLLQEILGNETCAIRINNKQKDIRIEYYKSFDKVVFPYTSQCSKMTAFKDALLWLLDKSGLEKKEEKQEKVAKLWDKIREIEKGIRDLEA